MGRLARAPHSCGHGGCDEGRNIEDNKPRERKWLRIVARVSITHWSVSELNWQSSVGPKQDQTKIDPPSTTIVWPVTKLAPSPTR
jgi:hypothetical protein